MSDVVVLAKLDVGKVILLTVAALVFGAIPILAGPLTGHGTLPEFLAEKPLWIGPVILLYGLFAWVMWLMLAALGQILFDRAAGVYLSGGRLVWLNPLVWSVRTDDIREIRAGPHVGAATSLILGLTSGQSRFLNLGFCEPGAPVASRLRQLCLGIRPRECTVSAQ